VPSIGPLRVTRYPTGWGRATQGANDPASRAGTGCRERDAESIAGAHRRDPRVPARSWGEEVAARSGEGPRAALGLA